MFFQVLYNRKKKTGRMSEREAWEVRTILWRTVPKKIDTENYPHHPNVSIVCQKYSPMASNQGFLSLKKSFTWKKSYLKLQKKSAKLLFQVSERTHLLYMI